MLIRPTGYDLRKRPGVAKRAKGQNAGFRYQAVTAVTVLRPSCDPRFRRSGGLAAGKIRAFPQVRGARLCNGDIGVVTRVGRLACWENPAFAGVADGPTREPAASTSRGQPQRAAERPRAPPTGQEPRAPVRPSASLSAPPGHAPGRLLGARRHRPGKSASRERLTAATAPQGSQGDTDTRPAARAPVSQPLRALLAAPGAVGVPGSAASVFRPRRCSRLGNSAGGRRSRATDTDTSKGRHTHAAMPPTLAPLGAARPVARLATLPARGTRVLLARDLLPARFNSSRCHLPARDLPS